MVIASISAVDVWWVWILLVFIEIKIAGLYKKYCWDDYHNGDTCKYGNSHLLWGLDKGSIANQSAISLIIRATAYVGIRWYVRRWREQRYDNLKIKKLS